jgi:hypothetical protein
LACVARIAVKEIEGTREITVSGRLEGPEVRRLEQACGPALERPRIGLHLRLIQVTAVDDVARALIARLVERGGTLTIQPPPSTADAAKSRQDDDRA